MLAELLADVESDPDDLTRLRLIGALRETLEVTAPDHPALMSVGGVQHGQFEFMGG